MQIVLVLSWEYFCQAGDLAQWALIMVFVSAKTEQSQQLLEKLPWKLLQTIKTSHQAWKNFIN